MLRPYISYKFLTNDATSSKIIHDPRFSTLDRMCWLVFCVMMNGRMRTLIG